MKPNEYLDAILAEQTLDDESEELKVLQAERENVEKVIKDGFPGTKIKIKYGGSKAKGTIIKENYDLDIISYVANGDNGAGETLKDIFDNHVKKLEKQYTIEKKKSAIRLKSKEKLDFHIDVVPGRYVDDKEDDTYLHQNGANAEKERLKTNLQTHIDHVKDSGYVDEIRLLKLWNTRIVLNLKTFVLELLAVKVLGDGKAKEGLSDNLKYFWETIRDDAEMIVVEDPANPEGNDLSDIFDDKIRKELAIAAKAALKNCTTDDDWKKIFGELEKSNITEKSAAISSFASTVQSPAKPWNPNRE